MAQKYQELSDKIVGLVGGKADKLSGLPLGHLHPRRLQPFPGVQI